MTSIRQRASKACNNCRARRIKCVGGVPCQACRDADLANGCMIRVKARPKRPASSKIFTGNTPSVSKSPPSRHMQSTSPYEFPAHLIDEASLPNVAPKFPSQSPSVSPLQRPVGQSTDAVFQVSNPFVTPRPGIGDLLQASGDLPTAATNPLVDIEGSLLFWSLEKGISLDSLCYQDEDRMKSTHATPLPSPPNLAEFENNLIRSLAQDPDPSWDPLGEYDQLRVFNLYGRYRVLPNSLTDDQKALVYASLCVAKHIQMKRYVTSGTPSPESSSREDLTYFHMACDALANWNRPSIHAMWALFCLAPCTQAHGGFNEMRKLMEQMAWQAKELGLNKGITAQLYPPQDMVQILFSTFHYLDTNVAGLSDLHLYIPLTDIDVDCTLSGSKTPDALYKASCHAAAYIQACMDPSIDTTTDEFVEAAETLWAPALSALRSRTETPEPKATFSWAEIRYHWLRILLYYPRTKLGPAKASHAWIMLARAVAHIIHLHSALQQVGQLHPSWPQLKRLSHIGQVLILCCLAGEIHGLEGDGLFGHLLKLLSGHVSIFAHAGEMVKGYTQAAKALGFKSSVPTSTPLFEVEPFESSVDLSSWGLFGPFDPLLLFNSTTTLPNNGESWSG